MRREMWKIESSQRHGGIWLNSLYLSHYFSPSFLFGCLFPFFLFFFCLSAFIYSFIPSVWIQIWLDTMSCIVSKKKKGAGIMFERRARKRRKRRKIEATICL